MTTGDYTSPPTSFPSANLAPCQHAYTVAGCHVITPDHQGGTHIIKEEKKRYYKNIRGPHQTLVNGKTHSELKIKHRKLKPSPFSDQGSINH